MRARVLPLSLAVASVLGLLTSTPAHAAYDAVITFPGDRSEFSSPFAGPATIAFAFDGTEADQAFSLRIRQLGREAIHRETILVDADAVTQTKVVRFDWPALTVRAPRTYEVLVRGGGRTWIESFLLRPPLVTVTGATPNPFLPWIGDGYKDTTRISFDLAANADVTTNIYRRNEAGRCCGSLIRTLPLDSLPDGPHSFDWDGRNEGGSTAAKGDYFVKVTATDLDGVTRTSKPFEVSIARTYLATATRSKPARNLHHVSRVTPLVLGGDCIVEVVNGLVRVLCQGAKVSVHWRWGLGSDERIVGAKTVFGDDMEDCPRSIRRTGHTEHGSSFTMREDLFGAHGHCWLDLVRITYRYPEES